MGVVELAIWVIVLVAVAAVVWWFVRESGIAVPRPFRIVLMAVVAILAILVVANLAGLGPRVLR